MRILVALLLLVASVGAASSQSLVRPCITTGSAGSPCVAVSAANPLPVTGGGGGGGAVTIADGADVVEGAVADAASSAGGVGTMSAKLRLITTQLGTINTTLGTPVQVSTDPCQTVAATIKPITITTATTTNVLTGTAAKKIYVCYLMLTSAAADNVAIISGTTGATCGANTAALVGGVTATNGLNFAANGGVAFGNGGFSVMQTQTNNDDICFITSANTPLAAVLKYVVQ